MTDPHDPLKHAVDVIAAGITVGALAQWLPPIAAAFTTLWVLVRLAESATVRTAIFRVTGWDIGKWYSMPGAKEEP